MPVIDRLRRFIRGDERKQSVRNVPSCVRLETDVAEYWTLADVVGDGAFGNVYKAISKSDPNRIAAAKSMELDDDEGTDVMVEVEILSRSRHPNIVGLYEAYTLGNRITLLLEFCGGGAVDSIMIELSRGLTEVQIHYIMKEILKALKYLHSQNVIHRDLKAGNVLLTTNAEVKLADFGVSAMCKDVREERSTFIGTPYWMAPEVMLCETFPEKKYGNAADIWSFGITMIEMADERPPYSEMNPAKVVFKIIKADPPTLEKPSLWSTNFKDAIARCLTKDRFKRPSAVDLLNHPFFEKDGDIRAVQRLIYEMNAEQVTTEVMEPEFDDDDDTSSSIDLRSGGDTHNELIELLGEEKGRTFIKGMKGDASDTLEAEKTVISSKVEKNHVFGQGVKNEFSPEFNLKAEDDKGGVSSKEEQFELKNIKANKAEEKSNGMVDRNGEDSIPPTNKDIINSTGLSVVCSPNKSAICTTEISIASPLLNKAIVRETITISPGSPYGHAACINALNDLDDALNNEESSVLTVPEETDLVGPALFPLGYEESSSEDDVAIKEKPTVPPTHSIRDIVAQAKTGGHVYEEVELKPPIIQVSHISRDAIFKKSTQTENVERLIKADKEKASGYNSRTARVQADFVEMPKRQPADREISALLRHSPSVETRNEVQSVPDISLAEEDHVHSGQIPKKYFISESPGLSGKAKSDMALNNGFSHGERKQQQMKAVFKVVPPANRELIVVEVGRPVSYPNATSVHQKDPVLPKTPKNVVLLSASEVTGIEEKKVPLSVSYTAAAIPHEVVPSTSSKVLTKKASLPNDFDYFESVPASSSNLEPQQGKAILVAPPPEPPVDYEDEKRAAIERQKEELAVSKKAAEQMGSRKSPHRQTVTKKTRVYMVDGVQMTSTSHQVFGVKQDFELRKQQLHDLRRMQREEARQQRELTAKAEALRNDQAKRFSAEKDSVMRNSEIELLALARNQKRLMKEAEDSHNEDMKQSLKKIQSDQERELRAFREAFKYEQKQLKLEIETLPKLQRKEMLRLRRDQLEKEQAIRENDFLDQQRREQSIMVTRVQIAHKLKILQLEKTFQQQKQAVLRSREAALWDLEERQLGERHALYKQELKDRFFLQRSQMLARHQREVEHMRKVNEMNEDEAVRSYAIYKKRLPKDFRTESKTRIAMFKESLRISCQGDDINTINEKLRAFEEKEKIRVRNAMDDHEAKAARKLRELKEKNMQQIKELEEIHNEKRKMLLEAENSKRETYEKEYEQVIADWKANLPLRKRELEANFAKELDELDAFYRKENAQLQSITSKPINAKSGF